MTPEPLVCGTPLPRDTVTAAQAGSGKVCP